MGEGKTLKRLESIADQVDSLEDDFKQLSDEELAAKTDEFRQRLKDGETLDDIMVEAFATVREAAWRTLRMRHFRVQIMGGAALHLGNIAEMKTGEGKTLVATLPAYLRAIDGKGVHVVTVNDYLASYQSELMGRVFRFLGLTTGCIMAGQTPAERREQYNADITYGTNNEMGFDFLRDNMATRVEDLVQRGHNFVIVDEVDSILIDEARTPLIISGPADGGNDDWYITFAQLVDGLEPDVHYEVDHKKRTVGILEAGIDEVEKQLGFDNLYDADSTKLIGFLNNAIKAKELFKIDKDYIIHDGEVLIVDEHTGRVLPGRRYNEGMHQAIEAKEGVEIKAENQTLATITLQNYFRLYPEGSRSGMTGTAETEAAEFAETYKIGVVPIPTNKPMIRKDRDDLVYPTAAGKYRAVVKDIVERHAKGQPILVGTTSVENSEHLSALLKKANIPHTVLNAKQHESEAAVVAQAGRKGAVTVATNMAGRGTDIMLGGNAEHIAIANLRAQGLTANDNPEEYEAAWPEALAAAEAAVKAEHDEVKELGGLYVLGTERHESRRIDNQLRGRSGRQGDPGESRFYLSMEDELMNLFASGLAKTLMQSASYPEDQPLEMSMVSRSIASAQAQVEGRNREIRKNVLKYDDVMTEQRELVYEQRLRVLKGEDLSDQIDYFIEDFAKGIVNQYTTSVDGRDWNIHALTNDLQQMYPLSEDLKELLTAADQEHNVPKADLVEAITEDLREEYMKIEDHFNESELAAQAYGPEPMTALERDVLLRNVDEQWRAHLYEMDYLKEGIGLRAMAQRDPLVEYSDEGGRMFNSMMKSIRELTVQSLFNSSKELTAAEERIKAEMEEAQARAAAVSAEEMAAATARANRPMTNRRRPMMNASLNAPSKNRFSNPSTLRKAPQQAQELQMSGPAENMDGIMEAARAEGIIDGSEVGPTQTEGVPMNRAERRKQNKQK
ncbi:preprotein translocase subunit SecA [Boudabousia tangfeifanii]|uniref:preprotein translocase subunit SecA n=1 Tax=Boudabousia tangfeifanii TaxID=1912795 RepID=UPI0009F3E423|nr:preprotein translocase subunit SecA [Boudabousia tangfeifanii]